MDLSSLSNDELTKNLRSLQRTGGMTADIPDNPEELVQELQVHRVEIEMQNRALRESASEIESALQRYSELYDHLPIGYITLTPNGRIAQANLTAAGWLRVDRARLIGGYFNWFLEPFDAGRFAAHLDACVQTGVEQTLELTLHLESGLLLTVQLTSRLAPPGQDGETSVNTAITHISKLQQANAVTEDIAREHEALTEFLTQQLQSPPATVSKFARIILRDHATHLTPPLADLVERMQCAAVRMERTLQGLLDYCLGVEEVALDPVNLEELMQHVVMEQRATIQRRGADITIERPLPCVRGARLLLGQVLTTVLTHALKRVKPNETPHVRVSARQQGREVVLTVLHEFAPARGADAAQNFRRFEAATSGDFFSGAALGFAIIKRTIERMHGRVWLETDVGDCTRLNIGLSAV
jgi:two-component system, chemotaxis family, sensor kinase Cph1